MSVNSARTESAQNLPTIAGIEISTDKFGRFNLNALHRASNEGEHKAPNQWLRTQTAKDLIAELTSQAANMQFEVIQSVRGGKTPGTFAHELLAVSYAAWISPAFHLEVNRVFIAYRKGVLPIPEKPVTIIPPREIRLQGQFYRKLYSDMGLTGRDLAMAVSRAVKHATGFDIVPMAPQPAPQLSASDEDELLRAQLITAYVSLPRWLRLVGMAMVENAQSTSEVFESTADYARALGRHDVARMLEARDGRR